MEKSLSTPRPNSEGKRDQESPCPRTEEKGCTWRTGLGNHQREDRTQNTETLNALRCSCFYTNANSLIGKMDEFKFRILRSDYHIVSVTESWATANITDAELSITGYSMVRKDRSSDKNSKGGGVIL